MAKDSTVKVPPVDGSWSKHVEVPPLKQATEPAIDDTASEESHPSDVAEETLPEKAIDEMTRGMVYASLAITDDQEGTLKKVRLFCELCSVLLCSVISLTNKVAAFFYRWELPTLGRVKLSEL